MKNEFNQIMSQHTDEKLIKIVTVEREKYQPIAVEAAESEIERRSIDIKLFEEIIEKEIAKKEKKEKVDTDTANSLTRLTNFLIDNTICMVLIFMIEFIIRILVHPNNQNVTLVIINVLLILGVFIAYYIILEIKFQKTVGKFITKTKVVKLNGKKPTNKDIITRTFCRFIPFDRFSFLLVKNGIHDSLSNTRVVNDVV